MCPITRHPLIMPQKIMDILMLGHCSHEFSWPRRAANGEYYQVCMLCATAYEYDWKTMRRGSRVEATAETAAVRQRSSQRQPTWMPRARRSEEHTSELQSLRHLVCRLLLAKK